MDHGTIQKKCFKCNEVKPLSDFYPHKMMADGHLNKCKDCTRKDVANHRQVNAEKIRSYDRGRAKTVGRKADNAERSKEYRRENPEKRVAVRAANNAIRSGKLKKKPCEICGATCRVEKHHEDYSKPLDVVFLCSLHHSAVHFGKICLLPTATQCWPTTANAPTVAGCGVIETP